MKTLQTYIIRDFMLCSFKQYIDALPIGVHDLQDINNSLIFVSYDLYRKHNAIIFGNNKVIVTADVDSVLMTNKIPPHITQIIDGELLNQPTTMFSVSSEFVAGLDPIESAENIDIHNRTNTFFTLNGRNTSHRTSLINELHRQGLLDKGLAIYHNPLGVCSDGIKQLCEQHELDMFNKDFDNPTSSESMLAVFANNNYYEHYNIEIIAETSVDVHYLTEKTAKALSAKMPFLMVSSQGFLAYLRTLGFKTFNSIWDESYDTITDTEERIEKIINVLYDLIHSKRVFNVMDECEDILNHNALHIKMIAESHKKTKTKQVAKAVYDTNTINTL
jgi:hypothetical protein